MEELFNLIETRTPTPSLRWRNGFLQQMIMVEINRGDGKTRVVRFDWIDVPSVEDDA